MVTVIYPNGDKISFKNAEDYEFGENGINIIENGIIKASIYRLDGLIVVKDENELDMCWECEV